MTVIHVNVVHEERKVVPPMPLSTYRVYPEIPARASLHDRVNGTLLVHVMVDQLAGEISSTLGFV